MQTGDVLRPILTAMMLLAVALTASCNGDRQAAAEANQASASAEPDVVGNTTAEAMCGTPKDRAHAIGRIAEDSRFSSDPDHVYEVASDLAAKGCPTPRR